MSLLYISSWFTFSLHTHRCSSHSSSSPHRRTHRDTGSTHEEGRDPQCAPSHAELDTYQEPRPYHIQGNMELGLEALIPGLFPHKQGEERAWGCEQESLGTRLGLVLRREPGNLPQFQPVWTSKLIINCVNEEDKVHHTLFQGFSQLADIHDFWFLQFQP